MAVMIGLTGGIGSGKSIIAKVFSALGIPCFNADLEAKKLMQHNETIREKLKSTFGAQVFVNGQLNRQYLANKVFSDPYQLEILNAIVHPKTIQAAKDWAILQKTPYVLKEAALIFESASAIGLEGVIGVNAPLSLRVHRVMQREHCSKEEVRVRMRHQIEDSIKMKLCDWVILNDDQHLVVPQVISIHEQILTRIKS